MLHLINNIMCENVSYSLDMVRIRLDFCGLENIEDMAKWLCNPSAIYAESYPLSTKPFAYRHLFKITSNNGSFVIGLGFNGTDSLSRYIGFIEFNPNKVANDEVFKEVYTALRFRCRIGELSRWDLAIDVPIERKYCHLQKDKRKYTLVKNSDSDKTEYLGQRSKDGFVKLYNKTIESELDYDCTRLEVTLPGKVTYNYLLVKIPRVDVAGEMLTLNPYLELSGTNLVLYELLMRLDLNEKEIYFNRVGRNVRDKLKKYVFSNTFDSDKFIVPEKIFKEIYKQALSYTIGIDIKCFLEA